MCVDNHIAEDYDSSPKRKNRNEPYGDFEELRDREED